MSMATDETAYNGILERIAAQEARVDRQERLIVHMAAKGLPTGKAEDLLDLMRIALNTLRASLSHFEGSN